MKRLDISREFLLEHFFELRKSQKQIAAEVGCHVGTIEGRMMKYGLTNQITSRYKVLVDKMIESDPVFMYTVGLFLTDGYIDKGGRLSIRIDDKEPIEALAKYYDCPKYNCNRATLKGGVKSAHEFNIPYDTPLTQYCRTLYQQGTQKTFTVKCPIPDTEECQYMLLRGIIDGDGAIRANSTDIRVFTASPYMWESLSKLLSMLKVKHTIQDTVYGKYKKIGWTIYIGTSETVPLLIKMYENYPEFAVKRKRDVARNRVYDIVRAAEMINLQKWE